MISQNRQLLNPSKGAITLGIYNPSVLKDPELQAKLVAVYDAWREARNNSGQPQAFITVFDPFAITGLMTYVYTMDRLGNPNGFAALRRIGASNGFHLDPYIAVCTSTNLLKLYTDLSIASISTTRYQRPPGFLLDGSPERSRLQLPVPRLRTSHRIRRDIWHAEMDQEPN